MHYNGSNLPLKRLLAVQCAAGLVSACFLWLSFSVSHALSFLGGVAIWVMLHHYVSRQFFAPPPYYSYVRQMLQRLCYAECVKFFLGGTLLALWSLAFGHPLWVLMGYGFSVFILWAALLWRGGLPEAA